MTRKEVIEFCLSLENTFEDYPFSDEEIPSAVLKHKENNKWFAIIMNVKNEEYLNVKTNPDYSDLLRNSYNYIIPAYHMNKEHWNTIIINNKNVDKKLVKELLKQSYELTKKGRKVEK